MKLNTFDIIAQRTHDVAIEIVVLERFLNDLDNPYPVCCGNGTLHGCCGDPEPAYHTPEDIIQLMRERLIELTASS